MKSLIVGCMFLLAAGCADQSREQAPPASPATPDEQQAQHAEQTPAAATAPATEAPTEPVAQALSPEAEAEIRAMLARVEKDLKTYELAFETFKIDQNAYPLWSPKLSNNVWGGLVPEGTDLGRLPTFKTPSNLKMEAMLTTPIAYISEFFEDPFSPIEGATYLYWTPGGTRDAWVVWSPGPDRDFDMQLSDLESSYKIQRSGEISVFETMFELTYDPTNGIVSSGDIFRVKKRGPRNTNPLLQWAQ